MICISMPPSSVTFDQRVDVGVAIAAAESTLSPPKRPKLSLQTTGCDRPRTFGKSTTSLVLSSTAGETNSPTITNTYFNAYHAPRTPTTTAMTTSITSPSPTITITTTTTNSGTTSLRSSEDPKPPYTQPLGIRSILRNGPLPRPTPRSASRQGHARLRFPPSKRVAYKTPLWEEIRTSRYTVAHFDLVVFEREKQAEGGEGVVQLSSAVTEEKEQHEGDGDDDDSGRRGEEGQGVAVVNTPLSPRKRGKQKREWTWTLASPLQQDEQDRERLAAVTAVGKPRG